MTRIILLAASIAAASLLVACATTGPGDSPATSPTPVGAWTLTALRGEPLEQFIPEGARTPTLTVTAEGRISGQAPINRYSGAVDPGAWPRGGFDPGPMVATRMGGPPEVMRFEMDYLGALDEVTSFAASGGDLQLIAGDGVLLRFERAE